MTDFSSLSLAEPIAKALVAEGYTQPTPIQTQAIPLALEGRDILGIAQTGTGKTAAFALPILNRLAANPGTTPRMGTRVLVLAPTRELAGQIAASFRAYGKYLDLTIATVFGGVSIGRQIQQMRRGVDVLVATPGRLEDLISQKAMTLNDVEVLVLDEADQMLDMGFIHALRRIVPLLPRRRQTLFFSATMPKTIADLAAKFLSEPAKVSVAPAATTAEKVEQQAIHVSQPEKQALLIMTLRTVDLDRALVFTRTKHGADKVVRYLQGAGIEAAAIHGNKSQPQRERALDAFRRGACKVLVATDIAARGVDVPGVSHVINFEIPNVPEQYVHRIGRTARAGATGIAISFIADDERAYIRDIEKLTRQKLTVTALPDNFRAEVEKVKAIRPAPKARPDDGNRNQPRRSSKPGGGRRPQNTQGQGEDRGDGQKPARRRFRKRRAS